MQAIKRILVPVDFSANSKAAFEFAVGLAEDLNASIKVVHILNEFNSSSPLEDPLLVPTVSEDYDKKLNAFIKEEEEAMGNVMTKRKVTINSETIFGGVVPSILSFSDSGEYDLLVMGVTGDKAFGEVMFGSTASEVSQKAKCPVLLVPRNYRYAGIMDILYACDFDHTSEKQIKIVADVADFFDANVNLLFVREDDKLGRDCDEDIEKIGKLFTEYAPNIEFNADVINEDTVVEGINEFCKENSVDMVVVVTKHRNMWQRFLHTSVTKQIAMYAETPVFIIHEN